MAVRPSTTAGEIVEEIENLIRANRRRFDMNDAFPDLRYWTARNINTELFGFHKMYARRDPKIATEEHELKKREFSVRYRNRGHPILGSIVTEYQTWVRHNTPKSKRQST